MDIENMPLLNGLYKNMSKETIRFHMPGHKGNINNFEELDFIKNKLFEIDKTEIPGLDNLHIPEGIIEDAQKLASAAYRSTKSYFLVNGSTCGIYSMILGATKPGDKVLVMRNCHRAVFMALMLGDLEAVYVDPEIISDFNIPGGLPLECIREKLDKNIDIKAFILTNPSYYGICSDLKGIVRLAHKHNVLVLVDEAHGAHFGFSDKLPLSAMQCGADASVVSIHKSLPAFTQASLLNISQSLIDSRVEFMLRVFQSTSPSYILMASIDAARNIMQHRGEMLLEELLHTIKGFRKSVETLQSLKLLSHDIIDKYSVDNLDETKIVIKSSFAGTELDRILLEQFNIQAEMSDLYNVVLIASIGDNTHSFDKLLDALRQIDAMDVIAKQKLTLQSEFKYTSCMSIKEAFYANKTKIKFSEALGRVSAEMVVPYPPGIPLLLPGELISEHIMHTLNVYKTNGIAINGSQDSKLDTIYVIE